MLSPIRYDRIPAVMIACLVLRSVRFGWSGLFGQWKSEIGGNPPDGPHNLLQEFWNQNKNVKDQRTKRARHWILAGDYCTAGSARISWTKQTDKTGGACSRRSHCAGGGVACVEDREEQQNQKRKLVNLIKERRIQKICCSQISKEHDIFREMQSYIDEETQRAAKRRSDRPVLPCSRWKIREPDIKTNFKLPRNTAITRNLASELFILEIFKYICIFRKILT